MGYADGHPVRLIGGRLALDFVNTADWSDEGDVVHEKLETPADLDVWRRALGLGAAQAISPLSALRGFRGSVRGVLLGGEDVAALRATAELDLKNGGDLAAAIQAQPLEALIAVSALSILSDHRERDRLKTCPGHACGWMFIDETKNARRRWCLMETCGNRAKAARHYARRRADPARDA